jgi:DNA-binding MarR family transcriptional regulator
LIESPAFVVMQAGALAMEWVTEALELFGLTIPQYATLAVIARLGAMTQAALADRLGISHAAMSRLASSLVDEGLAVRDFDYFDGRKRRLFITRAGAELVAEAADELASAADRFPPELTEQLAKLLPEDLGPILGKVQEIWARPA